MADYTIKIVDHTQLEADRRDRIRIQLQNFFNQVRDGTKHNIMVSWGTGALTDTIVLHFVNNVGDSYILKKMPGGKALRKEIGGHTRERDDIVGSEVYRHTPAGGPYGHTTHNALQNATLMFHECIHNRWPGMEHPDMDQYGDLALEKPKPNMSDGVKQMMLSGLGLTRKQLL
jgi:hypothetical protein